MGVPRDDSSEDEIKKWARSVALICLSKEFQELKNELEKIYQQAKIDDAAITAFQDALYAFLAQEETDLISRSGAS
jgi:hypothetical protein